MKLQYYLRGLGIGIIVTALVMGITKGRNEPLTEAEIRAMALEIGMVDSNSLKLTDTQGSKEPGTASSVPEPGNETNPEGKEDEPGEPSGNGDSPEEGAGEPGQGEPSGNGDPSEEGEDEPGQGEPSGNGDSPERGENESGQGEPSGNGDPSEEGVTVEIEPGAGSRAVCRMLEEAGLVEDAESFDQYLIHNGYSKRIRMGTYVIVPGTDQEEIARIITRDR